MGTAWLSPRASRLLKATSWHLPRPTPGPFEVEAESKGAALQSLDFFKAVFFFLCPFMEVWRLLFFLVGPKLNVGLKVGLVGLA